MAAFQTLVFQSLHPPRKIPFSPPSYQASCNFPPLRCRPTLVTINAKPPRYNVEVKDKEEEEDDDDSAMQISLWILEGVYIIWLFLLPYAPGDPAWAITSDTINSLFGLSLNFFFVLPLANAVGIHLIEAPLLHPMSEGLFNFVIAWTTLFAPLLFTDSKNHRYKGSLDVLWGFQSFLTNTFLIPYMAIRLNKADGNESPRKLSKFGTIMTQGAHIVGLVGGVVCLISIFWGLYGRGNADFGSVSQRWEFLLTYIGSERLAYAFIWDILLYAIFQPWLIGDNLVNVEESRAATVNYLRFVPVVGLITYLIFLKRGEGMYTADKSLND